MLTKSTLRNLGLIIVCSLLSATLSLAQGTLGRVTDIDPERGLIEIDGAVYSLTLDAIKAGASPRKNLFSFKDGHIVRYTAREGRIDAITLLDDLLAIPQ